MKGLILFILLVPMLSFAQDSRWIDIEWEEVPEAKEYQIELFEDEIGTPLGRGKFKTDTARWSHAVSPGKYSLRIRSVDNRGVPGEWGPQIPLKVRMQNPLLLLPTPGDKTDKATVNFGWATVKGADNYQFVMRNSEKDLILNILTKDLKYSAFVDSLGEYEWTVFALDKGEPRKTSEEIDAGVFRKVIRVGGELEAPLVNAVVNEKVIFSWKKVREAQTYEVDYLPPDKTGDKNRRFKLKQSPLAFGKNKLKEGITTLTVKSSAPGYQDSPRSIVKISRSGDKVEVDDIIQGRKESEIIKDPATAYFQNELFFSVSLARFTYESKNFSTDTQLKQKSLSGLGVKGEWHHRPNQGALDRKLEASFLQLSSGINSGFSTHVAYTIHKEKFFKKNKFTYGGGLSYLNLPSFMGDRFTNKVEVEGASSVGPEVQIGFSHPWKEVWNWESLFTLAYHPLFISSPESGEKILPWGRFETRLLRYYNQHQAVYLGAEYQGWTQKWSQNESSLSGIIFNLGFKTGF